MSELEIKQLSTGYWHIRGTGPCNWAQVPSWPCSEQELHDGTFPEASAEFWTAMRELLPEAKA